MAIGRPSAGRSSPPLSGPRFPHLLTSFLASVRFCRITPAACKAHAHPGPTVRFQFSTFWGEAPGQCIPQTPDSAMHSWRISPSVTSRVSSDFKPLSNRGSPSGEGSRAKISCEDCRRQGRCRSGFNSQEWLRLGEEQEVDPGKRKGDRKC